MKVALIQMNSQPDRAHNLAQALTLMGQAVAIEQPDLIVLPEHFDWSGGTLEQKLEAADAVPGGQAYTAIAKFAADNNVSIHAGSMLERVKGQDKIFNTSIVFNQTGAEIGRYRKLHLFDITTPTGRRYGESDTVAPGTNLFVYKLGGFTIGAAICYDLRFSNLFWALAQRQVDVIVLPAAFTSETGKAHWETLCRARAIEFQSYFLACGQWGPYPANNGEIRSCFGQSIVCDPWGEVVARAPDGVGWITTILDKQNIEVVRSRIPMDQHRLPLLGCKACLSRSTPDANIRG